MIRAANDRTSTNQEAFHNFKASLPPSFFSHEDYIQWQGSQAQNSLLEYIEEDLHIHLAKQDLYKSRPEYYEFSAGCFP
jgi:hypothetical protein